MVATSIGVRRGLSYMAYSEATEISEIKSDNNVNAANSLSSQGRTNEAQMYSESFNLHFYGHSMSRQEPIGNEPLGPITRQNQGSSRRPLDVPNAVAGLFAVQIELGP